VRTTRALERRTDADAACSDPMTGALRSAETDSSGSSTWCQPARALALHPAGNPAGPITVPGTGGDLSTLPSADCPDRPEPRPGRPVVSRRRRESNPGTGLCRPLPQPLGHAADEGSP
jgi:hypothetical protein